MIRIVKIDLRKVIIDNRYGTNLGRENFDYRWLTFSFIVDMPMLIASTWYRRTFRYRTLLFMSCLEAKGLVRIALPMLGLSWKFNIFSLCLII